MKINTNYDIESPKWIRIRIHLGDFLFEYKKLITLKVTAVKMGEIRFRISLPTPGKRPAVVCQLKNNIFLSYQRTNCLKKISRN